MYCDYMYLDVCFPQTIFAIIYTQVPLHWTLWPLPRYFLLISFFSLTLLNIHRDENNKVKLRKKGHLFHLSQLLIGRYTFLYMLQSNHRQMLLVLQLFVICSLEGENHIYILLSSHDDDDIAEDFAAVNLKLNFHYNILIH